MAGCVRFLLSAWTRTSGARGGRPGRRGTSRCAVLQSACTPASVRLDTVNVAGAAQFSRPKASSRKFWTPTARWAPLTAATPLRAEARRLRTQDPGPAHSPPGGGSGRT